MPYISTKTNIELAKEKQDALAAKYGKIISLVPGKTERWLMLCLTIKRQCISAAKVMNPWLISN